MEEKTDKYTPSKNRPNKIEFNVSKTENDSHAYSITKPIGSVIVQVDTTNMHTMINKTRKEEKSLVGFGDVIIYAIAKGLRKYPEFNSCFDDKLKVYPDINIGYFINIGAGAKLAIIKDADKMSLVEVSKEVKNLALKYIRGELSDIDTLEDTISLTNLASFGSYLITSPVFEHQSAMISVSSEFDSVKVVDGSLVPTKKFNLTLSFDGQVADCQKALQFLNHVKSILEQNVE